MFRSTYFSPNSVLGTSAAVTFSGIDLILSGLMPSVSVAPLPSDSALLTWPTMTPRTLTSALAGRFRPAVLVLSVTVVEGGELLGEDGADQPDARATSRPTKTTPRMRWWSRSRSSRQPASLTVVEEPQMAMDRNRSITLTATIEVRTARPTATPTPAGPPLAV